MKTLDKKNSFQQYRFAELVYLKDNIVNFRFQGGF